MAVPASKGLDMESAGATLSLAGKTALITGGSRGIGAAAVLRFHSAGAQVGFSYRTAQIEAQAVIEKCADPAGCVAIQQELASAEQGIELVDKAIQHFGKLDILVANHGIWSPEDASISAMSEAQWRKTMDVNLDSVFGLVKAAVAQMKKQERRAGEAAGHIVLISSTAGQRGEAFHADYAVTKGALISLTKSLSSELAPEGIYVNCVAPGWVETEMSASALRDAVKSQKIFSGIPLGRAGTPMEIAGPILFLCTQLAGFISGEVLNVNGGAVLVG
jgi:3-oxoacyl-[acyl-carrier protein] reductase